MDIQKLIALDRELVSLCIQADDRWHVLNMEQDEVPCMEDVAELREGMAAMDTRISLCQSLSKAIRHAVHPAYAESEADWADFTNPWRS